MLALLFCLDSLWYSQSRPVVTRETEEYFPCRIDQAAG